jgi:hypothetical protein
VPFGADGFFWMHDCWLAMANQFASPARVPIYRPDDVPSTLRVRLRQTGMDPSTKSILSPVNFTATCRCFGLLVGDGRWLGWGE